MNRFAASFKLLIVETYELQSERRMSPESKGNIRLEIGHVLFIDIVGYSQLSINEQSKLLGELNDVVRGTEHFRSAEAEGKLVRLPTGDGMALVFHNSPEEPARCALEISQALKDSSGTPCADGHS